MNYHRDLDNNPLALGFRIGNYPRVPIIQTICKNTQSPEHRLRANQLDVFHLSLPESSHQFQSGASLSKTSRHLHGHYSLQNSKKVVSHHLFRVIFEFFAFYLK